MYVDIFRTVASDLHDNRSIYLVGGRKEDVED